MQDHVITDLSDGILTIRMNRPERLNAWNTEMRELIGEKFVTGNTDPGIRAIIMTGTGERAFCAGQDLNEAQSFDAVQADRWIERFRRFYNAMRRFEKPCVIALNGLAAGSAFQVALLGDQRVGHEGSQMGQPEINSGILSITGFWLIREILGLARATDLVLTGRLMPAAECREIGIINHIVPREEVMAKARAVAEELAAKAPHAYRANKQRICAATQASFDDAFEAARIAHGHAFEQGGPQEVMRKFLSD
jgi:enoyl-CoA hydratase/carnithine racemase